MSNTNLYAPLAFATGIILLIFAIRPLYATYIENVDTIGSISAQQDTLTKKLSTLSDIQTQLQKKGSGSVLADRVRKYSSAFAPDNVLSALVSSPVAIQQADGTYRIVVGKIKIDKGSKLPSGLSLGRVSVAVEAANIDAIIEYIESLASLADIAFTVDTLSLPISTVPSTNAPSTYKQTLNFGFYYYEK